MLFNSIHFAIFFPLVFIIYFMAPHRWRWLILLIASYYFYMAWHPFYIGLILASTLIDYWAALKIEDASDQKHKKNYLLLSLFSNLGLLFFFKYFNFLSLSFLNIFHTFSSTPTATFVHDFLLPVGISFYTFQTLSYTLDVYWGKKKAERHFGIFALYVSFFPQLVAGPIERSTHLLPQFYKKMTINTENIYAGSRLMLWGLFKKIVIADRLAIVVDQVYGNLPQQSSLTLLVATYFFAFQIYCDFSGYTDIAIGCARILGFDIMKNFKNPYGATSFNDFWKRWHISLSSWFRDYLYIPLGGSRHGTGRTNFNLAIVFILSGLWHGANWTFAMWGLLHGFYLICEKFITDKLKPSNNIKPSFIKKSLKQIFIFHCVCLAWIFFRANNIGDALFVISHIFNFEWSHNSILTAGIIPFDYLLGITLIVGLQGLHLLIYEFNFLTWFLKTPKPFQWSVYYATILLLFVLKTTDAKQFIYFQF